MPYQHRPCAGGIVGHHPAERGAAGRGDVGRKPQVVRFELGVQLVEHDARLDACGAPLDVNLQQPVDVLGRVEHDAAANGLAGLRRSAAPQRQRTAKLVAQADGGDDVVAVAGDDDAQRLDLIDAGVGGVEGAGDAIEAHFAGNRRAKRPLQAGGIDARRIRLWHGRAALDLDASSRDYPTRYTANDSNRSNDSNGSNDSNDSNDARQTPPPNPRSDQRPRSRPACDGAGDDRSPRSRVREARTRGARRLARGLSDDRRRRHLSGVGHRSLGVGAGQHAVAGRSCAGVRGRRVRAPLVGSRTPDGSRRGPGRYRLAARRRSRPSWKRSSPRTAATASRPSWSSTTRRQPASPRAFNRYARRWIGPSIPRC